MPSDERRSRAAQLDSFGGRLPIEQIRTAVELQAGRHVKGKVVIDL